jgi:hypothetical protein
MWIKIEEAPDFEVSDAGLFRNVKTGRIYTPHTGSYYPHVNLKDSIGKVFTKQAHIVVAQYFLNDGDPIPKDMRVICLDDNPHNLNYTNLDIVERGARIGRGKQKTKSSDDFCVRYGDEIFC